MNNLSKIESLIDIYNNLSPKNKISLMSYGLFLEQSYDNKKFLSTTKDITKLKPKLIKPSADESVFAALSRLKKSYTMLNIDVMFDELSTLVSSHIVQGKNKKDVIIKLESIFVEEYQKQIKERDKC
ncbi:MAG: hypothetical protein DRQ51_06455 [Gammaproteobacteria bacterium]|nr:MAG: hypothetical protein DRQ51_06455 [Gammaproteobacteria bacterium]